MKIVPWVRSALSFLRIFLSDNQYYLKAKYINVDYIKCIKCITFKHPNNLIYPSLFSTIPLKLKIHKKPICVNLFLWFTYLKMLNKASFYFLFFPFPVTHCMLCPVPLNSPFFVNEEHSCP